MVATTWLTRGHQREALIRASLQPGGPACLYFISAGAVAWLRVTLQTVEPWWSTAFANCALLLFLCPSSTHFRLLMPFSVIARRLPLRRKMLREDKYQLPFAGTCHRAAFMLDVPQLRSRRGLWLRTAQHDTWARQRQRWMQFTDTSRNMLCFEQCFWFLFLSQLNGLHKISVNLMVHKNTFLENKH